MAEKALEIIDLLDELRNNNLYVHNDELESVAFNSTELKDRPVYLVETLATINVLVKKALCCFMVDTVVEKLLYLNT